VLHVENRTTSANGDTGAFDSFKQAKEFLRGDRYATAIVSTNDPEEQLREVMAIRRDPSGPIRPVFLLTPAQPSADLEELIDGVAAGIDEARRAGKVIADALTSLPDSDSDLDADRRVLHFLYARRNRRIKPILDWTSPRGHHYPLLSVLADDDLDVHAWAQALLRRELLGPDSIVTRLRECPSCASVHLNFVDRCGNCHGLGIERLPFLHCFRCGNVAPMAQFGTGGRLQCAKCSNVLRQIGVDYDRAIESFLCDSCKSTFSDAEVVAACLQCGRETQPPDLVARDVRVLELTEIGRLSARTGKLSNIFAALDDLNYANPTEFFKTLDWLLQLRRRYKQIPFSVVGIRFANVRELVDRIGTSRTLHLFESFALRVRELLRTTDISTRTTEEDIWMLLPFTNADGNEVVRRKIGELSRLVDVPAERLDLRVSALTGDDADDAEDGKLFVARLRSMME
jgi:GGDEF domain-containing protein